MFGHSYGLPWEYGLIANGINGEWDIFYLKLGTFMVAIAVEMFWKIKEGKSIFIAYFTLFLLLVCVMTCSNYLYDKGIRDKYYLLDLKKYETSETFFNKDSTVLTIKMKE